MLTTLKTYLDSRVEMDENNILLFVGYFSWRNNVDGSWFIQALVRVLREYYDQLDLVSMLTVVNQHVAYDFKSCTDEDFTNDMKQMPCFVSTLTKLIRFSNK